MKYKLFLTELIILLFVVSLSWSACEEYPDASGNWYPGTYASQSLTQADIASCVTAASSGHTINLKAGAATWNSTVNITKGVKFIGAGIDSTIITTGSNYAFTLPVGTGATADGFRIEQMTLQGGTGGVIFFDGSSTNPDQPGTSNWLIGHVKMQNFTGSNQVVRFETYSPGLIHNSQFINNNATDIDVCGNGVNGWTRDSVIGQSGAVYVEDCTFTHTSSGSSHVIAANASGAYVIRHSTITVGSAYCYDVLDAHGERDTN